MTRTMSLAALGLAVFLSGCKDGNTTRAHIAPTSKPVVDEEAEIRAALAELTPEDRKLAEAQKFCVIQTDERLGSMGAPVKVMIKDQPVFLCCGGCKKKAEKDPDETLAKAKELREKNAPPKGK